MKKDISKLFISAFVLLAILSIIDKIVGVCGDTLMTKLPNYSGEFSKDNFRLNRLKTDIVIIGSSRCNHHYVTKMLGDSINKYSHRNYSIYNAGIDGQLINSNSCATESLLKRYTPKLIIFEVEAREFKEKENEYADIRYSLPHYTSNETVHSYINELGWKERLKVKSNIYRYNGMLLRIVSSFMNQGDSTGYMPLSNIMKVLPDKDAEEIEGEHSIYSEKNFTRVLKTCEDRNINLIVVSSPRFQPNDNNDYINALCKKYNIPFIELYNLEQFNENPNLFEDEGHLNDNGAHIYTNLFFENIKPYLSNLRLE